MIKEERRLDKKRRPAFNGIMVDGGDVEYGKWRRHLVAIHVCEDLDDGPKFSKSFPVAKMNELGGSNSEESFAKKLIKRLVKQRAMAVMLEFDPTGPLGNLVSLAKCYANQLPATSIVLAVHKGKAIFRRQSVDQFRLGGFRLDLRPKFYVNEMITTSRYAKATNEDGDELLAVIAYEDDWDAETNSRNGNVNSQNTKALLSSISVVRRQLPESNLGWPLRRRSSHRGQEVIRKGTRNVSVVQWVMSLPNRLAAKLPKGQNDSPLVLQNFGDEAGDSNEIPDGGEIGNEVNHKEQMALSVSFIVKERSDSLQESEETYIQETESETSMSSQTTDISLESEIDYVSNNSKEREERMILIHSKEMSIENNALEMNQSVCKCFSYAELKMATSNFSAGWSV